jgi:poly(3-hydroxybutyrate) depolymerase
VLYQFHEMQRSFLNPLSVWAKSASQLYTNPYSPLSYAPGARRIAATLELTHRLGKDYEKPEWRIHEVETPSGPARITPVIAADKSFCNLIHFQKTFENPSGRAGPKLLIVAPLSGHHATLLRDTVRTMLEQHDVYVTDWVDARMVPLDDGNFSLASYVEYVQEFIRMLSPNLHLISVCQPTVPVLAAVSLMASLKDPAFPLTMTMMGGPIDTRVGETGVNDLAKQHDLGWFRRNVVHLVPSNFPGFMRRVYPGFLQHAGFISMNPGRHANSHWDYFQHLVKGDDDASVEAHREFYDEYNAVLDLDAEFYLDTIRVVFQEHLLPRGLWDINGTRVRPSDIHKTALLTIEGELDDISGPGQTQAAHALCTGLPQEHKRHETIQGAGHYGIFSGRRWRTVVAPKIAAFIAEHEPAAAAKKRTARA